jgi:mitochondrial fission protein ELM1
LSDQKTYSVWLVTDGKPGHQNQSEGLVQALASRIPVDVKRLPVLPFWKTLTGKLFHKNFVLKLFPAPDLVIGAGHGTHKTLLLVSWLFGAKSIVLMKPDLPKFLFDLCLIPEHDAVPASAAVIVTQGVLNRIIAAEKKNINHGLILIGGPSKHYGWDTSEVLKQIETVVSEMRHIRWVISDSRRTPDETSEALQALEFDNVEFISVNDVDSGWLPDQLGEASYVWVSKDSVSMVYEALTSGAVVGLLEVPEIRESRISRGVRNLLKEGKVVDFSQWTSRHELPEAHEKFDEAGRCAQEVITRCQLGD